MDSRLTSSNPRIGRRIECFTQDGERNIGKVVSRAGKVEGLYGRSYNVQNVNGQLAWMDLDRNVEKWREISDDQEILITQSDNAIFDAKVKEIVNWKENYVFEEVEDKGQQRISVRWVVTEKLKNNLPVIKARFVARGFDLKNERTDSPTCSKDSLRIILVLIALMKWECKAIDIKAAFL